MLASGSFSLDTQRAAWYASTKPKWRVRMRNTSKIPISDMRQVCSLGGGIASSALFLMSLHGEIEYPCEAGIFADTGWETQKTWETIGFLTEYAKQFGVPVYVAKYRNIREDTLNVNFKDTDMPLYVERPDGSLSKLGRHCTDHYKKRPIRRLLRSHFEATQKRPVAVWLGYSTNEALRMKDAENKYEIPRYPLIEKRYNRQDCVNWLRKNDFPEFEKSACVGCPFRGDAYWKLLTDAELADAADFEKQVENRGMKRQQHKPIKALRLHRSLTPINERPFDRQDQMTIDSMDDDEMCDGGSCFT